MLCKHRELPTREERYKVMKTSANTGSGTQAPHDPTKISVVQSLFKINMVTK